MGLGGSVVVQLEFGSSVASRWWSQRESPEAAAAATVASSGEHLHPAAVTGVRLQGGEGGIRRPCGESVAAAKSSRLATAARARDSGRQSERATSSQDGVFGARSRPWVLLLAEQACSGSSTREAAGPRQLPRTLCCPRLPRLAQARSPLGVCSPHPRYGLCRGTRPSARWGGLGRGPYLLGAKALLVAD